MNKEEVLNMLEEAIKEIQSTPREVLVDKCKEIDKEYEGECKAK